MGGGPKADDDGPLHLLAAVLAAAAAAMASAVRSGIAALGEIVEHDVHRAEVRGVGAEDQRLAGNAHRVRDARS